MQNPKEQAEELAREHFYSPGHFNEEKFVKDFALFLILRKQCLRYTKTGEINHPLALNNLIVALNSFGMVATNEIIRLTFEAPYFAIAAAFLVHLRADVPRVDECVADSKILQLLRAQAPRYNLTH